uniref:Uncharacterized protein n=1 Tax=Caenorhabditis japonica TaxID=281687 RepID=A0A8R1IC73_CAEJA
MDNFSNNRQSVTPDTGGPIDESSESSWWKNDPPSEPLTPITFSFLSGEQQSNFNFPSLPLPQDGNLNVDMDVDVDVDNDAENTSMEPVGSQNDSMPSCSSSISPKRKELLVVDEDESRLSDNYEPTAHLGWASFDESTPTPPKKTAEPERKVEDKEVVPPVKRKVYLLRSKSHVNKSVPIKDLISPVKEASSSPTETDNSKPNSPAKDSALKVCVEEEDDIIVDVVGIDEEDTSKKVEKRIDATPPDLPPQRPLNTRFESQRQRKDFYNRRGYDSEEEDLMRRRMSRTLSPPPRLERQTNDDVVDEPLNEKDGEKSKTLAEDDLARRLGIDDVVDPTQLLKTKVSSSAIPILPLSKSIMERKKAAIEMTKNAVIKRIPTPKSSMKNMTVAPKSVQVPAYLEKAPITLYSKFSKPPMVTYPRDNRQGCYRCKDRPSVDMSSFKFLEDTNVVAVRAHLCDQTRVMIARTAMWNREYAKRLGDRAIGTIWQKPDEVTAQMTGFCSATVRRCIDIANVSIVPKCADRIGVSKSNLASLQNAFGSEKFCGQTMRTPHVLSQYYSVKSAAKTADNNNNSTRPPAKKESEEEEQKRLEEER